MGRPNIVFTQASLLGGIHILGNSYKYVTWSTHGAAAEVWSAYLPDGSHIGDHITYPDDFIPAQKCAVKVPRVRPTDFQGQWDSFLQQYREKVSLWSKLSHKNIVKVLGLENGLELQVEYCENRSVREYLSQDHGVNKVPMMNDVLSGLAYLHAQDPPVVHGNLNAGKVFVDANGITKIGEFGLAALCQDFVDSVPTISMDGLSRWMSPELLDPYQEVHPTTMSDVWALGCTMLEIMTEQLPYSKYRHELKVQKEILAGTPPGHYTSTTDLPNFTDLWGLLEECWSLQPECRPSVSSLLIRFHASVGSDAPDVSRSMLRTQAKNALNTGTKLGTGFGHSRS